MSTIRLLVNNIEGEPENFSLYEETINESVNRGTSPDTVWLMKHPRALYFLANADVKYINKDYADEMNIPINRSGVFRAKETSIILGGPTYGGVFIFSKKTIPSQEKLVALVMKLWINVAKNKGLDLVQTGNDLVVGDTDRKIVGCAAYETDDFVGVVSFINDTMPTNVDVSKLFNMPKEKFANKKVKTTKSRITSIFNETGKTLAIDELTNIFHDTLVKEFGEGVTIANTFNMSELGLIEKLKTYHYSDDWKINKIGHVGKFADTESYCGFH